MRTKTQVDKVALLAAIKEVESKSAFNTRQALAEAVVETNWAKSQPKVTPSVVLLRIAEFNLDSEIKTKKGKRGRQAGVALSAVQKTAMQAGRQKVKGKILSELRRGVPLSKLSLVEKGESGSVKALVKLKCLDCSGYITNEVKHCTVLSCPLYSIRPYQ